MLLQKLSDSQRVINGVPRPTWDAVAAVLNSESVTVEAFDPQAPGTMRIVVSGHVARTITDYDARKLVVEARNRLGDKAIVYLKDDAGKTLAKAAPWGVSGRD